jgi:hypothetical protein
MKWTRKLQLPSLTNWGIFDQHQEQFDMAPPIKGYSRFWSDSSTIETFAYTITIPKDVVDCTALGVIAERVSHPTSSRSHGSCSPPGRSLHNESERVSCFDKWKFCHRALLYHRVAAGSR